MDQRSQLILNLIRIGRENVISSREITRLTDIKEREIQRIIEDLRIAGYPIAGAVRKPKGYFIPRNEREAAEYERHMEARIKSQCVALNCVKKAFKSPPVGLQAILNFDGEMIREVSGMPIRVEADHDSAELKEAV